MPEQERRIVSPDSTLMQHEPDGDYSIARGDILILTIGPDERVSYCNTAFFQASGYTRDELIGQPQVLFDRRDMPIEVLRDLRATLEAGSFWSSVIPTRRKSGERYWLHATIAPTSDACHLAGYTAVCTRPRRSQVRTTAAAYETMRRTAQRWSHAVCIAAHGAAVPIGLKTAEAHHAEP
jgi:aerotaxis receptor